MIEFPCNDDPLKEGDMSNIEMIEKMRAGQWVMRMTPVSGTPFEYRFKDRRGIKGMKDRMLRRGYKVEILPPEK